MARFLVLLLLICPALVRAEMAVYESRHYVIHSDLPADRVPEVMYRMDAMADEYTKRTQGFAGRLNQKLPFYLYAHQADYAKDGGIAGSAGLFDPNKQRLMAFAEDSKLDDGTWHTVQHEGFHQFAHYVIRGNLPPWLNEGLAEYFGESLWCGDLTISGVIPDDRGRRIRKSIEQGSFVRSDDMLRMTYPQWNAALSGANYDTAWAMVQFLAHGDNGKYQAAFTNYINRLSRGHPSLQVWTETFGDPKPFEDAFKQWWTNLPANPTADIYARATTARLASFAARQVAAGKSYANIDELLDALEKKDVIGDLNSALWLPPSLGEQAAQDAKALRQIGYEFKLAGTGLTGNITCTGPEKFKATADFSARKGAVKSVNLR